MCTGYLDISNTRTIGVGRLTPNSILKNPNQVWEVGIDSALKSVTLLKFMWCGVVNPPSLRKAPTMMLHSVTNL